MDETCTGGEAVVAALAGLGVRHVFGVASVHNLPIVDAIARHPDLSMIPVRHEQAAVHAADGYARASGSLGVALASTGPGSANAMGGLFEAAFASSPVLLVTSQVETSSLGKGRGTLHEAEGQAQMLGALCRRVESVGDRGGIVEAVERAAADALSGRAQPAAVEIPVDLQHARGPQMRPGRRAADPPPPPAPGLVDEVARRLDGAERPLLWAGGGVVASGASSALVALAERLGAPVITSTEGRGSIPEDHRLCLGPTTDFRVLQPTIEEADVIFAVGTRFQIASAIHRTQVFPGALVHLDVDPRVIGLVHRPAVPWVGDARAGLEALLDVVGPGRVEPGYLTRARAARDQAEADAREAMGPDHARMMDIIRTCLPRDAVVVKDVTVPALTWGNRWLPVYEPRTSMRPVSVGIGSGLPLAIGAAQAGQRPTLLIQGDGGLMLSLGEFATLAQEGLPVVVCIFNDRGYGVLRWAQDTFFEGRRASVDLVAPDFAALAGTFGIDAVTVRDLPAFEAAVTKAVEQSKPWVIDVDLSAFTPIRIVPQV